MSDRSVEIDYDGAFDVLRVNDFLGASESGFSFSVWLKPQDWSVTNSYTCILGQGVGVDSVFDLHRFRDSQLMQFTLHNSTGDDVSLTFPEISTGIWHHLAGTWDGQKVRFYHNGMLKDKGSLTGVLEDSSNIVEIADCWSSGVYPTGSWLGIEYNGVMD